MARRVPTSRPKGIPAGLSEWWVRHNLARGLTLEEAIEREQGRVPAKDRFDRLDANGDLIRARPAAREPTQAIDPNLISTVRKC